MINSTIIKKLETFFCENNVTNLIYFRYTMCMKKVILSLFGLFVFCFALEVVEAVTYSTYGPEYWENWIRRVKKTRTTYRSIKRNAPTWGPGYYSNRNRSISTIIPEEPSRKTNTVQRSNNIIYSPVEVSNLRVTVNSIRPKQPFSVIDETLVRVFEIGLSHANDARSTDFVEALLLDTLTFQMFGNSGLAVDPTKFDLSVNFQEGNGQQLQTVEEAFQFNSDGKVTLKFSQARMAKGESLKFGIDLKINNPATTPNIPGSFQIRLLEAVGIKELAQTKVKAVTSGGTVSEIIAFNPAPQTSGTSVLSGQTRQEIYGKAVSSGESVIALAFNFEAHYDDMFIQEVTVANSYGNDINSFVTRIRALDQETGSVLGESRFSGGSAKFHFSPSVRIDREDSRRIAFEVKLSDRLNHETQDTRFKLEIAPEDLIVYGYGSGREVPNANKNFLTNSESFIAVRAGGALRMEPSENQPQGFSANENLTQVYGFKIVNPETRDLSIGRMSLRVSLSGLEFSGGRSADDFELKQLVGGRETVGVSFEPTLGAGDVIIFDAINPLLLNRTSEFEFVLKLKLTDLNGNSDLDSVSVSFLRDSNYNTGTLANIRTSGANFIWSDHSSLPHRTDSMDWLSGYLLSGISTNNQIRYIGGER